LSKVTSKEVARLAGVSVSTVSIVLNGKPGVSEQTRNKVLNILEKHGYNVSNKNKVQSKEGIIRFYRVAKHGHIINNRHNVFINDYTEGIIDEAKMHNFTVEMITFGINSTVEEVVNDIRNSSNISGCIILATELSKDDIKQFYGLSTPVVFLDAIYDFMPFDFVTMDNLNMTYDIVNYLFKTGHRQIGMLYEPIGCSNFEMRKKAFCLSLKELGIKVNENHIIPISSTYDGAYYDMKKSLKKGIQLPTAYFACNDMVAIGAIRALKESEILVPKDISIVGFDDLPVSSVFTPPLTTMTVPKHEIGRSSVITLLNRISFNDYTSKKVLLGGKIVKRKSSIKIE